MSQLRATQPDILAMLIQRRRDYAIPLFKAMQARAKDDAAYGAKFEHWVEHGGTILLRDELAAPFKTAPCITEMQGHFYPFNDAWMSIDSARHEVDWARRYGVLAPVLIVVHPGSMYGSATFNLGRVAAQAAREKVMHLIDTHEGGLVIIDGALSDEIHTLDEQRILSALERAEANGHLALRVWGDDGGEAPFDTWEGFSSVPEGLRKPEMVFDDQSEAAEKIDFLFDCAFTLQVTGAWASPDLEGEGCVNSVALRLHRRLRDNVRVSIHPDSVFVPEEDFA